MKCTNAKIGCEWIGELGALDDHFDKCMFVLVECENECEDIRGETVCILRKDLDEHLSSECPNRIVQCELCKAEGVHACITDDHRLYCPEVVVDCLNDGCDVGIKRCKLEEHCEICPHEKVACKYSNVGCTLTLPRKDMTEHEDNAQSHLDIALETVGSLTREVDSLTRKVDSLTRKVDSLEQTSQKPVQFTFNVTNFENCKVNDRDLYSPAFYTSPGGYKMCLHVYANGYGSRNGTHVSAFIYLMKGENDHHLSWPFRPAKFTIEVLNQLSDNTHCKSTVEYSFDMNDKKNKRVTFGEKNSSGKGKASLIDHTSLFDRRPFRQYCVDDTVYFRVTVLEAPTPRAWLVCNT